MTNFNERFVPHGAPHAARTCRADIVQASNIEPEPFDWIWPDWLAAGKIHLLAGPPGTGKTTLAMRMAATISQGGIAGGTWPDGAFAPKGRVLIWTGEDGVEDTIMPRLIGANADLCSIVILRGMIDGVRERSFDFAKDVPALREKIAEIGGIRLIIIDSIAQAVKGDCNKNSDVRRALEPLVALAEEHRCAILGVTHLNKASRKKTPIDRVNGSIAFSGVARLVMMTAKISADHQPDQSGCVLVRAKSNIGSDRDGFEYAIEPFEFSKNGRPIQTSSAVWRRPIAGGAKEILEWAESDSAEKKQSRVDEAANFLQVALASGSLPATEVERLAECAGISAATLRRARERIGVAPRKITGREGSFSLWCLPTPPAQQQHFSALHNAFQPPVGYKSSSREGWPVRSGQDEQVAQVEHSSDRQHLLETKSNLELADLTTPNTLSRREDEQLDQVEHAAQQAGGRQSAFDAHNQASAGLDNTQHDEWLDYCVDACRKLYHETPLEDDETEEELMGRIVEQALQEVFDDSKGMQCQIDKVRAALQIMPWWE